jgi:hypothetical protein
MGLLVLAGWPISRAASHTRFLKTDRQVSPAARRGLDEEKVMTRKLLLLFALASLFALQIDSASACKVVGHSKSGEPLCMTTSDGPGQEYKDGRRFIPRAERARRIAEMTRGGTMMGGILVSPHVPGSKADKAWQAERKRLGFK